MRPAWNEPPPERLVEILDPPVVNLVTAVRGKTVNGYAVVLGLHRLGDDECSLFFDVDDLGKAAGHEALRGYRKIHQQND